MVVCFPDTQDNRPRIPVHLTRVGVTGVKKLIKLERAEKRPIILLPTFDAFVDLPSDQKGIHMSRSPEAISEVVEEVVSGNSVEVESLCADIVNTMMNKHKYAKMAEVKMTTDFMFMKKSPVTKNKTQEMTKLIANAVGYRENKNNKNKNNNENNNEDANEITIRKSIGAEVVGMTVCPCAQESVKEADKQKLLEFLDEETVEKVLDTVSFASHNQRGVGTILIEVTGNHTVRGEDIIQIIEDSMSSPVCELLKRPDENAVVMEAHKHPYFVEDCVRNMIEKIIQNYSHLPDDTLVTVRQVNEESIHRHNAFAEKIATMGELKEEIQNGIK
ncbi:MAG: GTP cyclohydrolase MptA [Methanobrevibacter sp.]|nr:GTP cyclohydrolase MptA [Methanobrevibacter sp.]